MHRPKLLRLLQILIALVVVAGVVSAAPRPRKRTTRYKPRAKVAASARKAVSKKSGPVALTRRTVRTRRAYRRRVIYNPWTVPTYAESTVGDSVDGEDLVVRRAAVEALGPYNGTVVAVDPMTGRILTMVNQRLALKSGFQPCSTVKVAVALAALREGLIGESNGFRLSRRGMNLTYALAHSNNPFFATLGIRLGYEKFSRYARSFGLGERAALDLPGEQPGVFPDAPPKNGGMGMLTSFGEGISLTPLELAAFLSSVSNGGTLYYLQYPRSQEEVDQFVPRVKRHLEIAQWIPEVKPGMIGAVEYGTARRAIYNPEAPICGKTGTCTEKTTHLGWFGSFNDFGQRKIVTVVLMTGGRGVSGPTAAQIAGAMYRNLHEQNYFGKPQIFSPAILVPR